MEKEDTTFWAILPTIFPNKSQSSSVGRKITPVKLTVGRESPENFSAYSIANKSKNKFDQQKWGENLLKNIS